MTEYIQLSMTTATKEDAVRISKQTVSKRLAACVQILGPIRSIYWWQDKMEEADEWLCIMKTRKALYTKLESEIREIHPYEEPEIAAIPIVAGSKGYLDWIGRETDKSDTE